MAKFTHKPATTGPAKASSNCRIDTGQSKKGFSEVEPKSTHREKGSEILPRPARRSVEPG